MLIKRTEDGDVVHALYESSNIASSTYNNKTASLSVVFKTGAEYVYEGVSKKDYSMFELADSQGKIFNKYIKQHSFTKGGHVDVATLNEAVESAKREEIEMLNNNILELAREIGKQETLDNRLLQQLISLYNVRQEKTS